LSSEGKFSSSCDKCGTAGQLNDLWCTHCGFPLGIPTDASRGKITEVNMILTGGIFGFSAPKCAKCGTKGKIVHVGLTIITKKRGMGIVTRTDTITKTVQLPSGGKRKETTEVKRQERAPMIRGTQRDYYRCSACNNASTRITSYEREDTEPRDTEKTVLVTKEVTKVPCKYCGNLVNLSEVSICPNCGGRLY